MTATQTCAHTWCDNRRTDHDSHIYTQFVRSSREPLRPGLAIGVGVYTDDTQPELVDVSVYMVDDKGTVDEGANMSIDEAVELVSTLTLVIAYARAAEAVAANV